MYRILIDSCGELFPEMTGDDHFVSIPLTLTVDGHDIIDDETFDQADFLKRVAASPTSPHSACPSPEKYIESMRGDYDNIYIITLSSQLSGSYNSACLARDIYLEELEDDDMPPKNIHVFDSKSASIGETLIGRKIAEFEEAGLSFDEVVKETDKYIQSQHTFFILKTLETLRKAGRLSGLKAMIANTLNIKPIMGSTPEGTIQQLGQARGMMKALDRMVDSMLSVTGDTAGRVLAISHCNALGDVTVLKEKIEKKASFKDIVIVNTRGVSSMYANDGGIIMVV
jgi:DegV family protein with EDD domain